VIGRLNMSEEPADSSSDAAAQLQALIREVVARCAFGPGFFAAQLRGLVRERCPDPREGLPSVALYLHDGERLDLCHVIGFAALWVALAVWETGSDSMRTELVPYESIVRVTIGSPREKGTRVGFDQSRAPLAMAGIAMTPEQALRAASGQREGP
jgi:hypothetical protein